MNWAEKKRQRAAINRLKNAEKILPHNLDLSRAITSYIQKHNDSIELEVLKMQPVDIFHQIKEIHQAML